MHWRHGGQTIDQLLDRVGSLGLAALQININGPRHRALTGTTSAHFRRVGARAREMGIALEVASGGTDPSPRGAAARHVEAAVGYMYDLLRQ